jgi:hypothetical protein
MEYDDKAKTELVSFCRDQFRDNPHELQIIGEFERDYHVHTPIWWYTCECSTYQMLNRALRIHDVEIIIKMGFFLRDVHRHIEQNDLIVVYRGKGMSNVDFDEIRKRKDGLLAFNTFLSTSLNEAVSLQFAQKSLENPSRSACPFELLSIHLFHQHHSSLFERSVLFQMKKRFYFPYTPFFESVKSNRFKIGYGG